MRDLRVKEALAVSDEAFDSHYAALTQDYNLAQAQKTENFRASGFFLPYYNKSTIAITGTTQANVNSVGYIKGGIMGGHFFTRSGTYGVYAGYEASDFAVEHNRAPLDLNINSYFLGIKYSTLIAKAGNHSFFIKADVRGLFNRINGNISYTTDLITAKGKLRQLLGLIPQS